MNKNQLFKKMPPIDLFERLVKIYGLTDINDCRKFTKDHLIKNKTLEKIEGLREELEEYYLPCKTTKYLFDLDEKKLITILRQIAKVFDYHVTSNEKYLNSKKVLQYSLEKNGMILDDVNYNLKIIDF
jgi:hypothetical protein